MALRDLDMYIVPMWTGSLNSRTPAGWLQDTGLTEKDYFVINGNGGRMRQIIDVVRSVATEDAWSHLEAQKVVRALADMMLNGNLEEANLRDMMKIARAARPIADRASLPGILLSGGLIESYGDVEEGQLIRTLAFPWLRLLDLLRRDPDAIHGLSPREFEELIAASYDRSGFNVTLTPRSGDHGRDVIAVKEGFCAVRIFDQVKRYKPGHVVTAEEASAVLGTVLGTPNVTKGIITTTSTFAPHIMKNPVIRDAVPFRLELRDRDELLPFLQSLREAKK